MKKFVLVVFGMVVFQLVTAQDELPEGYRDEVRHFINCMKKKDMAELGALTSFPLSREYPLPSIKDTAEFRLRFSDVFDDSLIAMIVSSNVKTDWSRAGWRGIMLLQGILWLDDDGNLQAVNYQSETERIKRDALIEKDRNSIHSSLQEFESPGLILETQKFRIRIDEMSEGTYRYASWSINANMSDQPDLILKNGKVIFEGSGGNHYYEFVSGNYKYICRINVLGTWETPPANLVVEKGKKEILNQSASIVTP